MVLLPNVLKLVYDRYDYPVLGYTYIYYLLLLRNFYYLYVMPI